MKPDNILVISNDSGSIYDVQFKLADLGVSHFKKTEELVGHVTDEDSHGTRAYGKPLEPAT